MRRRQFGIIQASSKSRIDLGLVLPGTPAMGRLLASNKLGSERITNKMVLTKPDDVDAEVEKWIKAAYDADK